MLTQITPKMITMAFWNMDSNEDFEQFERKYGKIPECSNIDNKPFEVLTADFFETQFGIRRI